MEVVWNEPQHFRTVRGKLDKFSTNGVCGGFCGVRGGMSPPAMVAGTFPAGSSYTQLDILLRT
jgi:hypothetical protein